MSIRSEIKNEAFYKQGIAKTEELQIKTASRIAEGLVNPSRLVNVKRLLYSQFLHLAIRKYSGGYPIASMKGDLLAALTLIEENWDYPPNPESAPYYFDSYPKLVWMISIGILLDLQEEEFAPLVKVVDQAGGKDWLLEYLLAYRIQSRPAIDALIFPKPYVSIKAALDESDPAKRAAILKRYLEKEWYPGHKEVYWYDNHKSKHDTFFGYWSFETAAVVKIAGIDDSSFRDNQYYPKDML